MEEAEPKLINYLTYFSLLLEFPFKAFLIPAVLLLVLALEGFVLVVLH